MPLKKAVLCCLFLSGIAYGNEVNFHYGANFVDINADGKDDLIVKTRWENTNAHSYDKYTFAIRENKKDDDGLEQSIFYEVFLDEEGNGLTTSEGADCMLVGYQFKTKDGVLEFTKYERPLGEGYIDKQPVTKTKYSLVSTVAKQGAVYPGDPLWFFEKESELVTDSKHCSVHEVWEQGD
ncbi:MAG: hypothetical protein OXR68_01420 [Alphaproteobacteria bacterium]|nr:hypothetical protein [Alphaproteobacteria bacterium]MDD9919271.1 hypothetical protein [Alphaproteobacteria bacterium]